MQAFELPDWINSVYLQCLFIVLWSADIVMNFRTGIFLQGKLVVDAGLVARRYARSWLFLDILLVALQVLELCVSLNDLSHIRLLRVLRLFRLLRLARLQRFSKAMELRFAFGTLRLFLQVFKMSILLAALVHFVSCIWFSIGVAEEDGWASTDRMRNAAVVYQYFRCARWTLAQMSGR